MVVTWRPLQRAGVCPARNGLQGGLSWPARHTQQGDWHMKSDIIDIKGMVHVQTEKAVLFSTDGNRANAEWLPLSQIEVENAHPIWTITLPEWLAMEKGLI
jgi:hypothetical protein